jgi:transcriptional enhancer factor
VCLLPFTPVFVLTHRWLSTVLKLLSNRHYSPPPETDEGSPSLEDTQVSDGASSSPSTSERIITERGHVPARTARALVHIDVLAANAPWSPSDDAGIVMGNPLMTPPRSPEAHTFSQTSQVNIFHSPKPRPLRAIDPVVTFTSPSFVVAKSSCSVYFDGNCVHNDIADVNCASTKDETGMFLYRTTLIPQYWERLCQSLGMFL